MSPERGPPRVLAVLVPALPLQRVLRERPPAGALAVVSEGAVCHATAPALAAGVRPGDSLVQARAACAGLEAVPLDAAADRAALRALAEALLSLSPVVEVAFPDAVLLDAAGARLSGSEPEAFGACAGGASARPLPATWASRAGWRWPTARGWRWRSPATPAGSGRGRRRARGRWRSPRCRSRRSTCPPRWRAGSPRWEWRARARWPRSRRRRSPTASAPRARRPAGCPVGSIRGRSSPSPPRPSRTSAGTSRARWACSRGAEPVIFAAKRLADRVAARLAGRGLGASRLRLTLFLDPRGEERVDLPLARPGADAALWLAPLRERLAGLRLPAPVRALDLAVVEAAEVPAEQLAVGDRPEVTRALDVALSRLAARLGERSLFAAESADRHRPEAAYRETPFRHGGAGRSARSGSGDGHRNRHGDVPHASSNHRVRSSRWARVAGSPRSASTARCAPSSPSPDPSGSPASGGTSPSTATTTGSGSTGWARPGSTATAATAGSGSTASSTERACLPATQSCAAGPASPSWKGRATRRSWWTAPPTWGSRRWRSPTAAASTASCGPMPGPASGGSRSSSAPRWPATGSDRDRG